MYFRFADDVMFSHNAANGRRSCFVEFARWRHRQTERQTNRPTDKQNTDMIAILESGAPPMGKL